MLLRHNQGSSVPQMLFPQGLHLGGNVQLPTAQSQQYPQGQYGSSPMQLMANIVHGPQQHSQFSSQQPTMIQPGVITHQNSTQVPHQQPPSHSAGSQSQQCTQQAQPPSHSAGSQSQQYSQQAMQQPGLLRMAHNGQQGQPSRTLAAVSSQYPNVPPAQRSGQVVSGGHIMGYGMSAIDGMQTSTAQNNAHQVHCARTKEMVLEIAEFSDSVS